VLFAGRRAFAILLLGCLSLASAITIQCNPLQRDSCPPNPALGTTRTFDFTAGALSKFALSEISEDSNSADVGAHLLLESGIQPSLTFPDYVFYGHLQALVNSPVRRGNSQEHGWSPTLGMKFPWFVVENHH
jgi:hypothetical protein